MSFIPDVFVIGATKAGTSTFWKAASMHESLCASKSKEVNFFTRDFSMEQLEAFYKAQFASRDSVKVDVSPNYSRRQAFKRVAERIYKANPDAKIIYIVRNPIDRIISHLHHNMYRGRIKKTAANETVLQNRDYLNTSKYYLQISEYLKFFPKNQILIVEMEDLKRNPAGFWSSVSQFLAVGNFPSMEKSYNNTEKRFLVPYYDFVHKRVKSGVLRQMFHFVFYVLNIKIEKPVLAESVVSTLKMELKSDAEKLQAEFGIKTEKWFL